MTKPYFRQVPNFEYVSRNPGEKYISEYIPVKNLFKRGKLREDIFGNLNIFEKYSIVGDERPDNVAAKFYNDSTLDWVVLLSNNILNIQSEWPMTQRTFDEVMLEKYGSYDNLYNGVRYYETEEIKNSLGITVLKSGLRLTQTWKTSGNFIETINSKITAISATPDGGITPSKIVNVYMFDNIPAKVGDQVLIEGVSEKQYNGRQIITSIVGNYFTYELPEIPNVILPIVSTSGQEQVIYTVSENSINSSPTNPRYYEYWDAGLGSSVLVPATSFVKAVTNYEYESEIENNKRNIYILKPRYLNVIFNDLDDLMPYKKGSQQYVSENLKRGDNIRLYE